MRRPKAGICPRSGRRDDSGRSNSCGVVHARVERTRSIGHAGRRVLRHQASAARASTTRQRPRVRSWRSMASSRPASVFRGRDQIDPLHSYGGETIGALAGRLADTHEAAQLLGGTAVCEPFVFFDLETTGSERRRRDCTPSWSGAACFDGGWSVRDSPIPAGPAWATNERCSMRLPGS